MRNLIGSRLMGIVVVLLAAGPDLPATPLKAPKRVVDGKTVDLSPLFKWWTKHDGRRPLAAWVHVTGAVVGTNAWGWVVEAQIEKTDHPARQTGANPANADGPARILLREPPMQDKAQFEQLSVQLKALNAQHAALTGEESQARNRADALSREQRAYPRSRVIAAEHRQVVQVENQAREGLKPIDLQIQDLKKKLAAYPNPDHYEVDCFALDTQRAYSGLPLYDHGQVYQ